MKKKVFLTILILFILLICSMIGVWIFISPKDAAISLAQDNVINENTIDDSTNTISDEIQSETNNIITELETEVEIKPEIERETSKQDDTVVEKTVSKTSSTSQTSTNKNTTSTSQNTKSNNAQSTNNTTTKSTTSPSNVQKTQPTEQPASKTVEKNTETPAITQPTRCTHNNNHGMDVGNCGKWFNTKNEAIAYYEEKINYWSDWWEKSDPNDTNADATYYKNCPTGYEIWSCMYCSKWTINLYYR